MDPERGFEPGSPRYKATALPFELSSIDRLTRLNLSGIYQGEPSTVALALQRLDNQLYTVKIKATLTITNRQSGFNKDLKKTQFTSCNLVAVILTVQN